MSLTQAGRSPVCDWKHTLNTDCIGEDSSEWLLRESKSRVEVLLIKVSGDVTTSSLVSPLLKVLSPANITIVITKLNI